jgi:Leucine-rich repeat (LRR) protein
MSASISGYIDTLDALFNLQNYEYKHIVAVDLSINNIDIFPDIITKFINLQYLNLAHNNISFLPENIGDLKKLLKVDLSNNKRRYQNHFKN